MKGTLVRRTVYVLVSIVLVGCSDSPKEGNSVEGDDQTEKRPPCVSQVRDEKPHESDEVETEIARMVGQLTETTFDAKSLCDKVFHVSDEKMRKRFLETLMDRAYSVRFEDVGDVHNPDWEVRQEIHRRLGYAYLGLQNLSLAIWTHLWAQGASQKEQFTPLFRYAEKMKIEAERLGKDGKGLSLGLDVIERIYGINQKSGNGSPDDFAWVEENFRRISGRQIRTESQVDADNRTETARKKAKQKEPSFRGAADRKK